MKKNRKKAVIILLFIAGFFSLSLLGITQSDSLEKTVEKVAVDQVVQQADEKAITDQQALETDKSNILDMNRKSGFQPDEPVQRIDGNGGASVDRFLIQFQQACH